MASIDAKKLRAFMRSRNINLDHLEAQLREGGLSSATVDPLMKGLREATNREDRESLIQTVANSVGASTREIEDAEIVDDDEPSIFHWAVAFFVVPFLAIVAFFYWNAQRTAPDIMELQSVADRVRQTCSSQTNLPDWFRCVAVERNTIEAEWSPAWSLTAQQDVALWAGVTTLLGLFSLLVTAAGVYYVARTLGATRRAAKAAESASVAAIAANEGFVAASKRGQRAYVSVIGALAQISTNSVLVVQVNFKNVGSTPARNLSVDLNAAGLLASEVPNYETRVSASSPHTLGPTLEGHARFTLPDGVLTPDQMSQFVNGQRILHFWGRIRYTDVFGTERTTTFRRRTNREVGPRVELVFDPAGGNDAD